MNLYFSLRKEFFLEIEALEKKHKLRLLKRLSTEEHEGQFLALITEIQFGLFFDKIATSLKYEVEIQKKTPDWLININGQDIVAEVVRLNPSASDKEELDFENEFMNTLEKIPIACFLGFDFDQNTIDFKNIDLQISHQQVEAWLSQPRLVHDKLTLFDSIEIEFFRYEDSVNHVCLGGGGGSINFDYRRLFSDKSRLAQKAYSYSDIIEQSNLPFIICLYMDFHTWFTKEFYIVDYMDRLCNTWKIPYFILTLLRMPYTTQKIA